MKKRQLCQLIPRGVLILGFVLGTSLSTGIAAAQEFSQVAAITINTTTTESGGILGPIFLVEPGDEFGAIVVLNDTGHYDIYVGMGNVEKDGEFFFFDDQGVFAQWKLEDGLLPPKFRDNVNFAHLSVKDRVIELLPRTPFALGLKGYYVMTVLLCTPGQYEFNIADIFEIKFN
ncbi:MAG TPA: hypothetical protein EYP59_02400 [Thiotrichaceae bacterium]|nr:hypothetical protein [Thiotrichaceae bacterium]